MDEFGSPGKPYGDIGRMQQELHTLIERMSTEEPVVDSRRSVSWQAHREAEILCDPAIVGELRDYLRTMPDNRRRRSVYFILGKLGQRAAAGDCVSILLESLGSEADKYVLSSLLDALSGLNLPADACMDHIFAYLKDDRWVVRHSAIGALAGSNSHQAEDRVLGLLKATTDPFDMIYCHATLGRIGSAMAIPYLEANAKSQKRDVRISAQAALEKISRRVIDASPTMAGETIQ